MRITRIEIENFRSIRHVVVELDDTTVFVGPNNAGKTAILDAMRFALTRRGQRGTGFSEYDVHMADEAADPKASSGVSIELQSKEREPGEWSDAIVQDLGDIVQLESMATGRRSVSLRTQYRWNAETDNFEPRWEFLAPNREPLGVVGAHRVNLERFWRYLPVFYLGALRDVRDEFSARSSQFWARLLKDLEIPPELESRALRVLDLLNQRFLKADPRLGEIAETLSRATRVAARDQKGALDLRMVPLKTWDLLSRAEIILRNEPDLPWLPLRRQGQGLQSLSVIFLFQAFVDHLLAELYEPGSEPVLALEEPETHLHPQAVRTLWNHIEALPGQKIVSTHSPYFVQHVPFRNLRLVRLTKHGTEVRSLPSSFSERLPPLNGLDSVVANAGQALTYEEGTLTVRGSLKKRHYRRLLACCPQDERRLDLESRLSRLMDRSSLHVTDGELLALETFARRMRGEIFFAERWLVVEGPADYLLVHAIAHARNYDLDRHGVSVIDAQNNGNPATFAALARALGIPWLAVFDGDEQGKAYVSRIEKRGFQKDELAKRCRHHPDGNLEEQLVADGMGPELRRVLGEIEIEGAHQLDGEELVSKLRKGKTAYAARLAEKLRSEPSLADRMPKAFQEAITQCRGLM